MIGSSTVLAKSPGGISGLTTNRARETHPQLPRAEKQAGGRQSSGGTFILSCTLTKINQGVKMAKGIEDKENKGAK